MNLLQERYGADEAAAALSHLNPVIEQLLSHRSVRAYLPRPVPPGTLETLVAAAQSASTSSNLQVWSVLAVEDAGRKERLSKLARNQAHVRDTPLLLVWLADLHRIEQLAARAGRQVAGIDFLEGLLLGVIDAALAAQNAAIAVESMGLSCVYIGGIRNQIEQVAAELALPPRVFPVFGMCVGYADPERPASVKPRLPQAAVLHHEQYDDSAQEAAIAAYDATMAGFNASQRKPAAPWSETVADRLREPASLHGREHLVAALHRLGFVLR